MTSDSDKTFFGYSSPWQSRWSGRTSLSTTITAKHTAKLTVLVKALPHMSCRVFASALSADHVISAGKSTAQMPCNAAASRTLKTWAGRRNQGRCDKHEEAIHSHGPTHLHTQ